MNLRRSIAVRAAGVLAGAAALTGALAIPAVTANASVATTTWEWCDNPSSGVGIDAWSGSTWWGEVNPGQCHTTTRTVSGSLNVQFFIDNHGVLLTTLTVDAGQSVEIDFSGPTAGTWFVHYNN
jgi:hypothetical protein